LQISAEQASSRYDAAEERLAVVQALLNNDATIAFVAQTVGDRWLVDEGVRWEDDATERPNPQDLDVSRLVWGLALPNFRRLRRRLRRRRRPSGNDWTRRRLLQSLRRCLPRQGQ
jgi:hypothetical protein